MLKTKKKESRMGASYSLKKEFSLIPGYLLLVTWVGFTAVILIWVVAASLSTPADIFKGTIFEFSSGIHFENYSRAWVSSNVSVFFLNSLLYAAVLCISDFNLRAVLLCAAAVQFPRRQGYQNRLGCYHRCAGHHGDYSPLHDCGPSWTFARRDDQPHCVDCAVRGYENPVHHNFPNGLLRKHFPLV